MHVGSCTRTEDKDEKGNGGEADLVSDSRAEGARSLNNARALLLSHLSVFEPPPTAQHPALVEGYAYRRLKKDVVLFPQRARNGKFAGFFLKGVRQEVVGE